MTTERGVVKRYIQSHSALWELTKSIIVDVGGFSAEIFSMKSLHSAFVLPQPDTLKPQLSSILSSIKETATEFTPQLLVQKSTNEDCLSLSPKCGTTMHMKNPMPSHAGLPTFSLNAGESPMLLPVAPPLFNSVSSLMMASSSRPALVLSSPSLQSLAAFISPKPVNNMPSVSPSLGPSSLKRIFVDGTAKMELIVPRLQGGLELELKKQKTEHNSS